MGCLDVVEAQRRDVLCMALREIEGEERVDELWARRAHGRPSRGMIEEAIIRTPENILGRFGKECET